MYTGGMARQPLGQHFLASDEWRDRVIQELGAIAYAAKNNRSINFENAAIDGSAQGVINPAPLANDNVNIPWIEIGAGHGEMTEQLAAIGAGGGARGDSRVIAIETDEHLAAKLRARKIPEVEVVHADVLSSDLASLAAICRITLRRQSSIIYWKISARTFATYTSSSSGKWPSALQPARAAAPMDTCRLSANSIRAPKYYCEFLRTRLNRLPRLVRRLFGLPCLVRANNWVSPVRTCQHFLRW